MNFGPPQDTRICGSRAEPARQQTLGIWRLGTLLHQGHWGRLCAAQPADGPGNPRWDYVIRTVPADLGQRFAEACVQLRRFTGAAEAVRHPHLVAVLDAAPEAAEPFLVMPRLAGRSLAELADQRAATPLPVVLWLVRQVCQAAAALHAGGFIHGDITPANVMVSPRGHVTLIDLGFAAPIGQRGDGVFRGSLDYAAPESSAGAAPAAAADVFSLGRLLWHLLAWTAPGDDQPPGIDAVADLIAATVATEPADRPTAEQLASRLMRLEIETLGQHIRPSRASGGDRQVA